MKSLYIYGNFNPLAFISKEKDHWDSFIKLKKHINQKSIFNFCIEGVPLSSDTIEFKKQWTKQQILDDFSKEYVNEILKKPADFILIDALSCVIPIREIVFQNKKTRVTYNETMAVACKELEQKQIIRTSSHSLTLTELDISREIGKFCEKILEVYDQSQIIIHEAGYPNFYLYNNELVHFSDSSIKTKSENIKKLELVYSLLRNYLPGAHFIKMPKTTYSKDSRQAFNYSQEYAHYIYVNLLSIIKPEKAQEQIMFVYEELFKKSQPLATKEREDFINVKEIIDNYEYQLELYNQKFREYENKFLELYNCIMNTDYTSLPWPKNELSFSEFINLKKDYPLKYKTKHSKFYYIFVYPWSKISSFIKYAKKHGFRNACKKAKKNLSQKLKEKNI